MWVSQSLAQDTGVYRRGLAPAGLFSIRKGFRFALLKPCLLNFSLDILLQINPRCNTRSHVWKSILNVKVLNWLLILDR